MKFLSKLKGKVFPFDNFKRDSLSKKRRLIISPIISPTVFLKQNSLNIHDSFIRSCISLCPKFIKYILFDDFLDQLFFKVEQNYFLDFFFFFTNYFSFNLLVDLTAIDFPQLKGRFKLFYNLLSIKNNLRIFCFINLLEDQPIPSVQNFFLSANWLEREVWDFFGIIFSGHFSLRRILTDYGFSGFPLRKDFPLTGYLEVRFDEEVKNIIYEPAELSQEYRFFDFQTPWN